MLNLQKVILEITGPYATLWLNQPGILNALNPSVIEELIKSFRWLGEMKDIRVIILRGKGGSFCAGADLNWMKNISNQTYRKNFRQIKSLAECFRAIYRSDKAVISMLHGNVYGGALGLIGAGDIIIANKDTLFRMPELRLGLVPALIMPYLLPRLKFSGFRYYMLSGAELNADDAQKAGLVDIVCENEAEMEMKAEELIRNIALSTPGAVADAKSLLRKLNRPFLNSDIILRSAMVTTKRMRSDDAKERMINFLMKK
jgi:methylglutaconyl-CoA hydratase